MLPPMRRRPCFVLTCATLLHLIGAPTAQALMLPGGLWHAMHAVAPLEAEFGRPVLLNITATTWAALRSARIPLPARPDPRWGRLLASL